MSDAPADQITDFQHLYVRQTGLCRYTVLNLAGDEPTAYPVNTEDLVCRCEDLSYNKQSGEVCKHLAAALFKDPHTYDLDTALVDRASQELDRLSEAVQRLEQTATARQADQAGETDSDQPTDATETSDQGDAVDQSQAVETMRDWLETGFAKPQLVDVRPGDHDRRPGVVVEPDNQTMSEGVYESFKSLIGTLDDTEAHVGFLDEPCSTCGLQDDEFYYFVPTAAAVGVGD